MQQSGNCFAAIKDFTKNRLCDGYALTVVMRHIKYKASGDNTPMVIFSTASPYKFTKDVMTTLDAKYADGIPLHCRQIWKNQRRCSACASVGLEDIDRFCIKNVCEKNKLRTL